MQALVISQGDQSRRYTPGDRGRTFSLDSEGGGVQLSVLTDGEMERVQYILSGFAPGHDRWGSWVVVEGATAQPVDWFPQPGTIGSIHAVIWYKDGIARRSPEGHVEMPMPPDLFCPPIRLQTPPPVEAADWGQSAIDQEHNLLMIDWIGERAFVPLTADPETCEDGTIKGQLQWVQSDLKLNYKGLGVAVRDFVEDGGLPGVPLERYWLSRARIVESGGDRATIAIRLVAREMGDGSVVEEGLEAAYREGRWSVRLGDR